MPATNAANRYFNVKNFAAGGTTFTTIASVSYQTGAREITDSGDNEFALSFAARGVSMTRVTINLKDPLQAEALRQLNNTDITFNGVTQQGGTANALITLSAFTGFADNGQAAHGALWGQSVSGICAKADGSNPVAVVET